MRLDVLVCPACAALVDADDSAFYCANTTYWGDGPPRSNSCAECGADFLVEETVVRTWRVVADSAGGRAAA